MPAERRRHRSVAARSQTGDDRTRGAGGRKDPALAVASVAPVPAKAEGKRGKAVDMRGRQGGQGGANRRNVHRIASPLWCYYGFIGLVTVMVVFGLVMVLSSSSVDNIRSAVSPFATVLSQAQYAIIGLVGAALLSHVPMAWYTKLSGAFFALALIVQTGTMIPGLSSAAGGNVGWVNLGFVRFQPAEILKLALCVWMPLAILRGKRRYVGPLKPYMTAIIGLGAAFLLVMAGNDLGTGMIILAIGGIVLLVGGLPLRWWFGSLIGGGVAVTLLFIMGNSNRLSRFTATYGDCSGDAAQDVCYQILHGMSALESGGLLGRGLGASREKWSYLPEAHNDFIFAVIGEELGFLGSAAVIIGFVLMAWCLVVIAVRHSDPYARMVLLALTTWISGQALVNIMVVVRLFPVIGVPMPFVSAGGTALICCMAGVGVAVRMAGTQKDIAKGR